MYRISGDINGKKVIKQFDDIVDASEWAVNQNGILYIYDDDYPFGMTHNGAFLIFGDNLSATVITPEG